jgi:hypothetical protein
MAADKRADDACQTFGPTEQGGGIHVDNSQNGVPVVAPQAPSAPLPVPPLVQQPVSHGQAALIVRLLVALVATVAVLGILGATSVFMAPKFEYKTVAFATASPERTGTAALEFASVTPEQKQLDEIGSGGWEIVASYLEMETAFPNFGDSSYVTGLQPNVRPQRLVLILKRRV